MMMMTIELGGGAAIIGGTTTTGIAAAGGGDIIPTTIDAVDEIVMIATIATGDNMNAPLPARLQLL